MLTRLIQVRIVKKGMRLTLFEKSWLRLFGVLGVLITAFFLIQPILPSNHQREPLADPASLELLLAGKPLPIPKEESVAEFLGAKVTPPSLATLNELTRVLGTSSDSEKRIEVDLTNQRVYAFEGNHKVHEFIVSTGKWGRTPTGNFRIWAKVKSQKMSGGSASDNTYYYLPNVPWVMFFSNNEVAASRGFSFHGTYWHNNFGHPMSHGCVNISPANAEKLYNWVEPPAKGNTTYIKDSESSTPVTIYGTAPKES